MFNFEKFNLLYQCWIVVTLHEKQYFFFQMFWKDGLSKKIAVEYDLSFL